MRPAKTSILMILSLAVSSAFADTLPATLDALINPSVKNDSKVPEVSAVRAKALRDTAFSVGARGGLLYQSKQIMAGINHESVDLDRIFQFGALQLKSGVLPPVITVANDAVESRGLFTLHVAGEIYRIKVPARFVTAMPSWRDYLYVGLKEGETVEAPHSSLLPKGPGEREIWVRSVKEGWKAGVMQANEIYEANVSRLKRDFNGMIRYKMLYVKGMITAPEVAGTTAVAAGNGDELSVNDSIYRITGSSKLETDSRKWKPLVYEGGK